MVDSATHPDNLSPIKRALLEIREMRAKLEALEQEKREPIAVVGLSLRFPGGANTPAAFWNLLRDGVDAICPVPPDRWQAATGSAGQPGLAGGFIEDITRFDAHFFSIAPREAAAMDPQQRLLLEVSWEALEQAGQAPDKLNGSQTGVFIGISGSDHFRLAMANPANTDLYFITGNAFSVAAGRLSYTLGLQGPGIAVDTACSSSLVAVHLACQSLRAGECELALAGGVNLMLSPEITQNFAGAQMMAADDHCKTFDAAADGYVRGEGCAVIVLKRLSAALANGDNILAVIRGSAVNQDGRSSGLTAPNGPAQEAVIRRALANAGVEPAQIAYVETHGTGTPLGDPIEVQALAAALGEGRPATRPVLIGSVKTNIGHLEAAAGIAGLIKMVLALQHGQLPPHLNLRTPNPYINWSALPVAVATQLTDWPAGPEPRLAGVSSFGFSGTNAHIILEEAPANPPAAPANAERPLHLLALSAKRDAALVELAGRFEAHLSGVDAPALADACFTANAGRAQLNCRLAVTATSATEAAAKLAAFRANQEAVGVFAGHVDGPTPPEVAFLFTGHGAQYAGMGRQLYDTQPVFRAALEQCQELLRPYLDYPLLAVLYPANSVEAGLLEKMTYGQPAMFALEYALARLWQAWGVQPAVVMGHSLGEYVAACVAGVFSLADGLKLVAARGRLMDALPEAGEMVSVLTTEARAAAAVAPHAGRAAIAAINGPESVVISGASEAIRVIVAELQAEQIKTRPLAVAQAAHSPLLDPILAEFEQTAAEVSFQPPQISLVSGVTGRLALPHQITTAAYWREHLRQPVQFARGMATLHEAGFSLFVEIGPHPTLLGMGRRCLPEAGQLWLPSLRQSWADWAQLLESLAELFVRGAAIDWAGFDRDYPRRRVALPTYPWGETRYWLEINSPLPAAAGSLWDGVTAAGQRQAQQAPLDLAVSTYPARWACLDRLTTAYVVGALRALGAFSQPGQTHSVASLLAQTGIQPGYHSLVTRWLKRLVAAGLAQPAGEAFTVTHPLPELPLESLWAEAQTLLADTPFLLEYLARCGQMLTAVLTGAESPLETLFPGGSFDTADYLYHKWSLVRYYNEIIRAMVQAASHRLPVSQTLRLLEIGAGTGGTASVLIPALPAHCAQYWFTDVSELFLSRAAENFSAYPFVQYGLLDIEREPQAQGYPACGFDVVVAANVLHATRSLPQTLAHVRSLLAPGGLLLLFEATIHLGWFDMTTGLIEGWGRFEDDLRPDNPLLTAEQWQTALLEAGFEAVVCLPEAGSPALALGQQVVAALAPAAAIVPAGEVALEPERGPLRLGAQPAQPPAEAGVVFRQQLAEVLPEERQELLINYTRGHITRILRLPPDASPGQRERLLDLGLDSLMAVELRNRLGTGLGLTKPLSATLIFDYPTIEAIANYLADQLFAPAEPEPQAVIAVAPSVGKAVEIDLAGLSDAEVEAMLLKKLKEI